MSDTDLNSLQRQDLNQLVSLAALLQAGGVTRAAELLNVTQPTVSKALTRLRETFGDPLLVRRGNSMHLTPFANDLSLKVQDIIGSLDALYHPQGPFDPQTVSGWLKFGANDYVQSTIGLPFVRRMREAAPNICIELRSGIDGYGIGPRSTSETESGLQERGSSRNESFPYSGRTPASQSSLDHKYF